MPPDETRQLAKVAAVLDDADKLLDQLFANVAELKEILRQAAPAPEAKKEADE